MENNSKHILVVDDDDRIRDLLKDYLEDNNFITSSARNAEEAAKKIEMFKFDLIVLDVMMPGKSGFDLTKEIRKRIEIPIILLTAKGEVENRIKGLEFGADDYLGKPFEPKELLLRIKNIIKKSRKADINKIYKLGKTLIDLNRLKINFDKNIFKINSKEKKVLLEMLGNPGKTFSRDEMIKISGINNERSIDVMITRLRQKIESDPKKPKYLQTIRGTGYVIWID
ncbi:MAG: DNA-binding response regulator [Candidatus Pelagibacter sp.]|nr:DNA-binding response regulator [Candidatus Pelagibacter sp.]OUW24557.1 MAG: DNA-binding response regulator [Rickettsiales bacterium TMED174]|tara:strand:- start:1566 stop:2243 length:678 start_codon:yes stop_codon:yes gene_type:complete